MEKRKTPRIRFKGFSDDWEQRKFAEVFTGMQNNTFSRSDLNYKSGEVKNIHYGDILIKFDDYIDIAKYNLPYINAEKNLEKYKESFLQDGDVVISDTAEDESVGKCVEIQGSTGLKSLAGLHTMPYRPKEKYGKNFLGYYMNSVAFHNQLFPLMQGIKVVSISKTAIQNTYIMMPKLIDEQSKLGSYFSKLSYLITLHQRQQNSWNLIEKGVKLWMILTKNQILKRP